MGTLSLQPTLLAITVRRLCFALLVAVTVGMFGWQTLAMLQVNGWTPLKAAISILFILLLLPLALSFWTAVLGFLVHWWGGDTLALTRTLSPGEELVLPRSAVIMPVYNEDPARVFAGVKATYRSLEATGFLSHFDIFLLSDTTDPDIWVREELAFADLRNEVSDPARLFYRNRRENLERKTGNIADFCASWGDHYAYMIVFDADSVMTGTSLLNLVRLMEKNPHVGLIQAPPLPVNRRTLFGRLHQFAMQAYSTIFLTGLNFWQGGASNYWGHNAIIRIAPFVEHCHLPKLSGKPPLGGSILSHDFVEAAFLRRAGWRVYVASELTGSYEELPSSLLAYAARDRRWCQGNLQHARLLFTPGLHLINRLHLFLGVMAYLAAPLWLLMMVLTTLEGIYEHLGRHHYFATGHSLFPTWHVSVQRQAAMLFICIMALLLLPKLLSLVTCLRRRSHNAGFGGPGRFTLSVLSEAFISTLLAPNLALLQTRFVLGILMGKNTGWDAADRGEPDTTFREASLRHWSGTLLGLIWGAVLLAAAPNLFWWFAPVILAFLLAIPLSVWSSRVSSGQWARQHGLFLIPEETDPPEILKDLQAELDRASARPWARSEDGLALVLGDPAVRAVHCSLLLASVAPKDELTRHHLEGLQLELRHGGLQALSPKQKRELLLDPDSIGALTRS
jgi:membrane glycosyltransferase